MHEQRELARSWWNPGRLWRDGLSRFRTYAGQLDAGQILLLVLGTALAIAMRISLLDFKSVDYDIYTKVWYNAIQTMGYSALKGDFSNYNPPYLYLLYLVVRFLPNMAKVAAIKVPSIIADFLCAAFIYQIVRLKNGGRSAAFLGYMATLAAPVVILNSSFWGQADSIYTAGLLACVYFLLVRKNWLAFISFGLSFIFKLQAIFLLPLLLILWLKREVSWKHFLVIPLVYFIAILPAWLIGRPLGDLLTIYFSQADQYNRLSMHAPSLYAWFPTGQETFGFIYPAGLILAATVILLFMWIAVRSKVKMTPALLIELGTFSTLLMPFMLPKMHQRYFFPGDILSIAFGFYFPAYFYVPLVVNMVSFFSYQYFLFGPETFPVGQLAIAMLLMIGILGWKLFRDLYPQGFEGQPEASLAPTQPE